MKRKINFRYFLILGLSLICIILFLVRFLNNEKLKTIFLYVILTLSVIFGIISFKYKNKILIILCSILFISSISVSNIIIRENNINENLLFNNQDVIVNARISTNYRYTSSKNLMLTIDDVKIFSSDKFMKLNGKLSLYIEPSNLDLMELKLGRYIEFKAKLNLYSLETTENLSSISSDVVGYVYTTSEFFVFKDDYKISFRDKVQNFVYKKLQNCKINYADIGFALIFGDIVYIETDIKNIFQGSGIAHLLAVSGLNISIIVTIMSIVFNKLKTSKKTQLIINIIILGLYSYLCNFSISVIRASLMTIILLYAKYRGKPYDKLSTLFFIASLILIIDPLKLYNYSFILSFSTVLFIILFHNKFKVFLNKFFYNNFADSLSLNLSVQLGLIIVQLFLFKNIAPLSLISNLILVPVSVLAFGVLLITLFVSIIFPFMGFSMKLFDIFMSVVIKFGGFINNIGLILINFEVSVILFLLYYLVLFVASSYYFEKKKVKLFIILNLIVIALLHQSFLIM